MFRRLKKLFSLFLCFVIAGLGVRLGPNLYVRFFGNPQAQWISETYAESLREKNELVVYELEVTGQETVTQDAWLLGTVQKVEMPYTFTMAFVVDLSQANVTVNGTEIAVYIPSPKAGYPKLIVDEANMKKNDWLYPLTPERYAEIKSIVEKKLVETYASNPQYLHDAWNRTVYNLKEMFAPLVKSTLLSVDYTIRVVRADS